jgi:hypothetical protein
MRLQCTICDRVEGPLLRFGRLIEDVRVQDYPKRGCWFLVEKGQPLCIFHPRIEARFQPTEVMTPANPRWAEFYGRLEGPEGCDFHQGDTRNTVALGNRTTWPCKGGTDQSLTRKILAAMGFTEPLIEASCRYFKSHGGFCDCEVLFNVHPMGNSKRPLRRTSMKGA